MASESDIFIKNAPAHVAIIMDGNGRWAKERGKPRIFGHKEGANRIREVMDAARKPESSSLPSMRFLPKTGIDPRMKSRH